MTATRTRRQVVRTQVEPRLEQRRREVRDEERRRRRRSLVLVGVVLAVVAALVAVGFSPLLDVDRIQVRGLERLDASAVRPASGLATGDPMVAVDLDEARDALRSLPGVRGARVERHWPSTVRITLAEEEPAALVLFESGPEVISTTGRVLEGVPPEREVVLPLVVHGEDGPSARGGTGEVDEDVLVAAMALHRMDGDLRDRVASASLDEHGLLSLELTDGATVRLGPLEGLPAKLGAAEAVIAQVNPECWDVIDVREPARVTVSRTCEGPEVTDDDVASEQPDA